jgi:hypothetical protein
MFIRGANTTCEEEFHCIYLTNSNNGAGNTHTHKSQVQESKLQMLKCDSKNKGYSKIHQLLLQTLAKF